MYESYFGFRERPFAAAPLAKRYFPGAAIEAARQAVGRCIERIEGAAMIVGPSGTGKTLLCQVLAEQFRGQLETAQLASGRLPHRRALLQAILFELGLPYRDMDEGDLRLSLIDHLAPRPNSANAASEGLLLIVDEAHTLPLRLMEELRLITNLVRNGQPRVRMVLVGGPPLEERFASPKLESLNQRIVVRGYLESLDQSQTLEYVRHQIEHVGGNAGEVFTEDALNAVRQATDGIPRLINQVCDHALLLAYAGGMKQLTAAGIEEAWADLQQLPMPWSSNIESAAAEREANIIEFGQLDDDSSEDLPAAVPFPTHNRTSTPKKGVVSSELGSAVEFAAAEDDFQPAGSIHPEVELTFQSLTTPFHTFDEEEVVLDRYTLIERDALANRPLVRGPESRELAAMLPPIAADRLPPIGIGPKNWAGGTPTDAPIVDSSCEDREVGDPAPATDTLSELPDQAEHFGMKLPLSSHLDTAANSRLAWVQTSDDELIVIEEPAEPAGGVNRNIKQVVRRQEYRQLFAKLRHG
ncbi:MAG: AAA family ATPase [Pirellulales bacterium]|nr:AAA family ATPase [Pirellulales bacterium]